jgi:hypothetical protein
MRAARETFDIALHDLSAIRRTELIPAVKASLAAEHPSNAKHRHQEDGCSSACALCSVSGPQTTDFEGAKTLCFSLRV